MLYRARLPIGAAAVATGNGIRSATSHFCYRSIVSGVSNTADGEKEAVDRKRLTGKVMDWHPFDRRGVVVESETGKLYTIANARAFETVLPTLLRSLDGATVSFFPDDSPDADRVIVRSRTDEMTERFYDRQPPVDYYNPFANNASDNALRRGEREGDRATPPGKKPQDSLAERPRFAKDIVVDLSSIPSDKLARITGPLVSEEVIKPTTNLKDMRSSRIFDKQTNEYLHLRRALGSTEAAEAEMQRRAEEAQRTAVKREVVATNVSGVIVAWSAIHRSGVVLEGVTEVDADAVVDPTSIKNASIIRNVFSFQSALPTSQNLLHRRVSFTKTQYSTQGGKSFAEDVVVLGDLAYDASAASVEEARERREHEKLLEKRERQLGVLAAREIEKKEQAQRILRGEEEDAEAATEVPQGPIFGVITRWSGGQGTVESGGGKLYYIQSAADFQQLVERESHNVRGAVVTFTVDQAKPRYAREVSILSTAASSVAEMKPLLDRVPGASTHPRSPTVARSGQEATEEGDAVPAARGQVAMVVERNERTGKSVPRSVELEPEDVDWLEGTLLSWSPHEDQGIISGSDGTRFVLRDAEENIIQYGTRKALFKKGRRVKFTAFGTTGKLACNVVALASEADEEELRESELRPKEPRFSIDGNMDEAIASPMSTSYWIGRMTKSGYDVSEVKNMQNKAITLDEFDDESDDPNAKKLLDSEDIMKNDEWWRDPRKNKRLPNSEMTAGHLALMGPASMLNTALKAANPKTLNKMVNKYQSRLTEEQKEMAWQKAKEMAPKYEEQVKKAREQNEEPKFYFF